MERPARVRDLVRCLDCGTEYRLELGEDGADPCPDCGGVGWIAVPADRGREAHDEDG